MEISTVTTNRLIYKGITKMLVEKIELKNSWLVKIKPEKRNKGRKYKTNKYKRNDKKIKPNYSSNYIKCKWNKQSHEKTKAGWFKKNIQLQLKKSPSSWQFTRNTAKCFFFFFLQEIHFKYNGWK